MAICLPFCDQLAKIPVSIGNHIPAKHVAYGRQLCSYMAAVMSIPTTAATMTAVASHPVKRRAPVTVNWPMTFVLAVRSIISTITGTATTPLMTADQKSAWIVPPLRRAPRYRFHEVVEVLRTTCGVRKLLRVTW